jgi:hypothetical protein
MISPSSDSDQILPIQTFVFLDFEGSGLKGAKPRITELSMVALHRSALMEKGQVSLGRVMDELTLCINPMKHIPSPVTEITGKTFFAFKYIFFNLTFIFPGLDNYNLSYKKAFDADTVSMINCFLRRQQKPVCIVAYNGKGYDFGLLKSEVFSIGEDLLPLVYCADPYDFFREEDALPPLYLWSPKKIPVGVRENGWPTTPERPAKRPNSRRELFPGSPPLKKSHSVSRKNGESIPNGLSEDSNGPTSPGSPAKSVDFEQETELESIVEEEVLSYSVDKDSLEIYLHEIEAAECATATNEFDSEDDELLCQALDEVMKSMKPKPSTSVAAHTNEPHGVLFNEVCNQIGRPKVSYRMQDVYLRTFGSSPARQHHAKDDCYTLAQIFHKHADKIVPWCDRNGVQFQHVVPLYAPVKRKVHGDSIFQK